MTEDDKIMKYIAPKFPSTLSPDQLREQFEKAKISLPTFVSQYMNEPEEAPSALFHVDEPDRVVSGMMALTREGSRRYLGAIADDLVDNDTFLDENDEVTFEVRLKRVDRRHVIVRVGCEERVVHNMKELKSLALALLHLHVPKGLFEGG